MQRHRKRGASAACDLRRTRGTAGSLSGTAGIVTPELAARLGLCGLAGRASGQKRDLRVDFPRPPYDQFNVRLAFDVRGDVAARVGVRFDELIESLRLIRLILDELPESDVRVSLPPVTDSFGVGWVEGWRGEVMVALEADAADASAACGVAIATIRRGKTGRCLSMQCSTISFPTFR